MIKDITIASQVPLEPGTVHLKPGYVRLYHQTSLDNVDSIKRTGLRVEKSKGRDYGEGTGVWADIKPFYGKSDTVALVEFQVPLVDVQQAGGAYAEEDETPQHFMSSASRPVLLRRDIKPKEILAIHLPWHEHYRYLVEENMQDDVKSGKYDKLLDTPDYGPAIKLIKEGK